MINVEQLLSMPLAETFTVNGLAPNIIASHNLAWDGLTAMLGTDPLRAWKLASMQHTLSTDPKGVVFVAEFVRNPNYEEGGA